MKLSCVIFVAAGSYVSSGAEAGVMHARSIIGLGIHGQTSSHHGVAHAVRNQGSKYRVSHAQKGSIYTHGNAGSGHAHHHGGSHLFDEEFEVIFAGEFVEPVRGEPGTVQSMGLGWHPNDQQTHISVSWNAGNFLQIDLNEITFPGAAVMSSASISIGEVIVGTIELWGGGEARGDGGPGPFYLISTGLLEEVQFGVLSHGNGIFSISAIQPPTWTFPGNFEDFELGIEGEIVPAPASGALVLIIATGVLRRRRAK